MSEAPKRIRIDPDYDGWMDQIVGWDADRRDYQGRYFAPTDWPEYVHAAEHDRLMAEKTAEIKRLRAAIGLYAKVGSWLLNGPCDPDGPNFIGLEHAEIALGGDKRWAD